MDELSHSHVIAAMAANGRIEAMKAANAAATVKGESSMPYTAEDFFAEAAMIESCHFSLRERAGC